MKLISSEFYSSPMRSSSFSAARTTVKLHVYPYKHSFPYSRKDPTAEMGTDFQLHYIVRVECYSFVYLPYTWEVGQLDSGFMLLYAVNDKQQPETQKRLRKYFHTHMLIPCI